MGVRETGDTVDAMASSIMLSLSIVPSNLWGPEAPVQIC